MGNSDFKKLVLQRKAEGIFQVIWDYLKYRMKITHTNQHGNTIYTQSNQILWYKKYLLNLFMWHKFIMLSHQKISITCIYVT